MSSSALNEEPEIGQAIEDNILALVDTVGVKDDCDIEDDRLSFIEAVYALCIAANPPKAPTQKVHEAVYRILEGNHSKVLNLASYLLLIEISQQYPHILVREIPHRNGVKKEIVLYAKKWLPFRVNSAIEDKGQSALLTRQVDSARYDFKNFIRTLDEVQKILGRNPEEKTQEFLQSTGNKVIGLLLKFKYLFSILCYDFQCRMETFKNGQSMDTISSSLLVGLFKEPKEPLVKCLLYLIATCGVYRDTKYALDLNDFSLSLQSILEMKVMSELEGNARVHANLRKVKHDISSKPTLEVVVDSIHYDRSLFENVLQAMADNDLKLKIIFNYVLKEMPKPMAREMIENPNTMTVQELLNCFTKLSNAKSIFKNIETLKLQLLLAYAFKIALRQTLDDELSPSALELSRTLNSAFENLQTIGKSDFDEIHLEAKRALITAMSIVGLGDGMCT